MSAVFVDEAGVEHTAICPITDGHMYCECRSAEEMETTNEGDPNA